MLGSSSMLVDTDPGSCQPNHLETDIAAAKHGRVDLAAGLQSSSAKAKGQRDVKQNSTRTCAVCRTRGQAGAVVAAAKATALTHLIDRLSVYSFLLLPF